MKKILYTLAIVVIILVAGLAFWFAKQPKNIGEYPVESLTSLDLSNKGLTSIPAEIGRNKSLKILNLSHNNLTGIPAEIGQLSNLEVLDLSYNKLTGLPYELGNLKNLKTLNLTGNKYAEQDLNIILKSLPANVNIIK